MAGSAEKDNPFGDAGREALKTLAAQDAKAEESLASLAADHFERSPGSIQRALESSSCASVVSDLGAAGKIVMCCFLVVLSWLASKDFTLGEVSDAMRTKMEKRGPWWRKGLLLISKDEADHLGLFLPWGDERGVNLYSRRDTEYGAWLRRLVAGVCERHARMHAARTHARTHAASLSASHTLASRS